MTKNIVRVLLLLCLPVLALAMPYDNTLNGYNVTLPATYTNGQPIAAGDLKGLNLYWRDANGGTYLDGNKVTMPLTATSVSPVDFLADQINAQGLPDGDYYIVITTFVDPAIESGFSNEVLMPVVGGRAQKGAIANLPMPPTNVTPQ